MNETLKTLWKQIGMNKLSVMVGATNIAFSNEENYISFKFKMNKKVNHCRIQYNAGADLYNMEFSKVGRVDFKSVQSINGIYADQLNDVFESYTGLLTHL